MKNTTAAIASFLIALSVVLGAWNAHGMEDLVNRGLMSAKYIKTFHTGVQYQFYCSLGLLALSLAYPAAQGLLKWAMRSIGLGMVVFSCSLYLLAFHEILSTQLKMMGAVAPIGGLLMAIGWLLCGMYFIKTQKLSS